MSHPDTALGRRALVRGAATAAWAAPLIVVATAAPAFAESPLVPAGAPVLTFSTAPYAVPTNQGGINVVATLRNTGTVEATSVALVLTVTPLDGGSYRGSTVVVDIFSTEPSLTLSGQVNGTAPGSTVLTFASTHSAPAMEAFDGFEIRITSPSAEVGMGTVTLQATPTPTGVAATGNATYMASVLS